MRIPAVALVAERTDRRGSHLLTPCQAALMFFELLLRLEPKALPLTMMAKNQEEISRLTAMGHSLVMILDPMEKVENLRCQSSHHPSTTCTRRC